jgi:hypothetical protein
MFPSPPTLAERLDYARDTFAAHSFRTALRHIEIMLSLKEPSRDMLEALSASILTFYFRPFKKSRQPALLLSRETVPPEYMEVHKNFEIHRDKVYAHRDLDAPDAPWGNVNDVGFVVSEGSQSFMPAVYSGVMAASEAKALHGLILKLLGILEPKIGEFFSKHVVTHTPSDGHYVVVLKETSGPWFELAKSV